jgi:hypothetical protein
MRFLVVRCVDQFDLVLTLFENVFRFYIETMGISIEQIFRGSVGRLEMWVST